MPTILANRYRCFHGAASVELRMNIRGSADTSRDRNDYWAAGESLGPNCEPTVHPQSMGRHLLREPNETTQPSEPTPSKQSKL